MEDNPPFALDDPNSYAIWVEERVRFADLDLLGHVNNVAYGIFSESGRVAFVESLGWTPADRDVAWVIATLELAFKAELHYPARVAIGTRPSGIKRSSLVLRQGMFAEGRCVCTTTAVAVHVVRSKGGAVPIEGEMRAAIEVMIAGTWRSMENGAASRPPRSTLARDLS